MDITGFDYDGYVGLGRYVADIPKPIKYVIFCDTLGAEGAYMNPYLQLPEDFSNHTPIERHDGRFNALFLEGHVEALTHDDFTPDYFIRDPRI